ncbi:hypothetical protein POX_c03966 [Penicillium oxalicum]|uniref:hypothetical protein n=1 Tax=Penicillium oxalicum TaxID=69781 RepID=UPI0020B886DE|nr:hypothetical protein POX_c03966 [Penicillium oxalicum]KAI2791111.1 hypothetical protein POX_c03966 [Penicillium oxalicum]
MVLQSQPGLHSDHIEFPARPSLEEDPNGSSSLLETPNTLILRRKKLPSRDQSTAESPIIVCPGGDLILHYVSSATAETYYWKVDRNTLRRQSSYFNVLLDPTRSFIESQSLAKQLATLSGSNVLPIVKLPATPFSELYGIDALELFLQVTFLTSLKVTPLNEGEESLESLFSRNVLALPLSSIARLIAVAQFYQNEASVYQVLKDLKYLEKSKFQLHKFSQKTMKLDEDRIRQTIVIAKFLRESEIVKKSSHALVVSGSTHWTQAPEVPDGPHLPWQFLADGMEEELFYRRQCVLNTINDSQAYFLRKYGGLDPGPQSFVASGALRPRTTLPDRTYQCRAGLDNANQCDIFELGQMIRFFSVRAKSIFIGSSYIDPDFSPPSTHSDDTADQIVPVPDLASILVALKKYPDYHIDQNHHACGLRRRLLPILDCIEKFVMDGRGLLGITPDWSDPARGSQETRWKWAFAKTVHITLDQISHVELEPGPWHNPSDRSSRPSNGTRINLTQEQRARALFTARRRVWEPETF